MGKFMDVNKKIEKVIVSEYQKIEDSVVVRYRKIEDGVVSGYKTIENKFVNTFLKDDSTAPKTSDKIIKERRNDHE